MVTLKDQTQLVFVFYLFYALEDAKIISISQHSRTLLFSFLSPSLPILPTPSLSIYRALSRGRGSTVYPTWGEGKGCGGVRFDPSPSTFA